MSLSGALSIIQSTIYEAQNRVGLSNRVEIVAVTKSHPISAIHLAHSAGIKHIGENKVQEADSKFRLEELAALHLKKRMIGHLQSNKANKAVEIFDTIDSIDSVSLAKKLNAAAGKSKTRIEGLLQVNTTKEKTKSGFLISKEDEMLECCELPNLSIKGLMAMASFSGTETEVHKAFETLRVVKEKLNKSLNGEPLADLSMGMSGDYHIAVEEGSTMVRLGTALFGPRMKT